jgi:hypothetical protein
VAGGAEVTVIPGRRQRVRAKRGPTGDEPGIQTQAFVAGFRVRSFSDKIDFVNFARNSRPGMTA